MEKKMNLTEILNEIRTYFIANADEARVEKYARYFKEGFDAYGVHQDLLFEQKDIWLKEFADLGLEGFLDLGDELVKSGKYEEGSLAILFLEKLKKQYTKDTFNRIGGWFDNGISNWAHTDFICSTLFPHFFKKGICDYMDFADWRASGAKFKRRAVPVGMLNLLKLTDNYQPFFEFIDSMMLDPDKPVQQGLGWFLRESWKKQPEATETFLLKWKNSSPRVIFQYATEKMTKENKERFRKEKVKKT